MKHKDFWCALETVAEINGLTCSGLAKQCGLDSTVLNKSKRYSCMGQPRWLSLGTLVKILEGTGMSIHEFVKLIPEQDHKK